MEKENFMKVISEEDGRILLKPNPVLMTLIVKEKLDMNYVKNIVEYLKKTNNNPLIIATISVLGENKEEKDKILGESLEKLRGIVNSIIFVPTKEKDYLKIKKILEGVANKISKFSKGAEFINTDIVDIIGFLSDNIGVYVEGGSSGNWFNKISLSTTFLVNDIPEEFKEVAESFLLKVKTSPDTELDKISLIKDAINKKISKELNGNITIEMSKKFKEHIKIEGIFVVGKIK